LLVLNQICEQNRRLYNLSKNNQEPISTAQGEALAKKIGAKKYLECSALTQEGLAKVFEEAVKVILFPQKEEEVKEKKTTKGSKKEPKDKEKDPNCLIQ